MNYFTLIRGGVDVAPLLDEVNANEQAWLLETGRQDRIRVQRDTNTIFLSGAVHRPDLQINENQECRLTPTAELFPKALAFMTEFAAEMNCRLSRATIVRLKPRSQVHRHIDIGSYYFLRDRFHFVLRSPSGSVLMSGGETVRMQEGELWWFDNKQFHESYNESDEWRIHYIFDLLPAEYSDVAVNPVFLPAPAATVSPPREMLLAAIRDRAILRGTEQRLISPTGTNNDWLIDLRRVLMDPSLLDAAAELFWHECAALMPFQVGGMEAAAIPLLSAILLKSLARGRPVNGFTIRKERKTYGTGSSIEGTLNDLPIVIVDDVLNSGRSLEKARAVLAQENRAIAAAFVLIDYDNRTVRDIPVHAPFHLADFDLAAARARPRTLAQFENRWRFASPDPNFFHRVPKSFPATDGKRVYFGSDCGTFWCLNAQDGSPVWKFAVSPLGHKCIWSSPAIHDGKVYFGSYDGNVYCLDCETGREIWRFTGADWIGSSPALAPELGLLFIGLEFAMEGKRGSIVALNLHTGEKVWEHGTTRYTHASPAYWPERQLMACGSNDNEMFLFHAASGELKWRFETKGSIRHAPAFDTRRGHLITGCADGCIYIIDVETGREVWSVKTENTIYTIPLVVTDKADDKAYVGSTDKHMYVLDLERRAVKRKIFAASKVFGPPRLLKGRIYFGACNGVIYEIDPASDEITGTHQLPDAVTNALTHNLETGDFYGLTYVNELFAFRHKES